MPPPLPFVFPSRSDVNSQLKLPNLTCVRTVVRLQFPGCGAEGRSANELADGETRQLLTLPCAASHLSDGTVTVGQLALLCV